MNYVPLVFNEKFFCCFILQVYILNQFKQFEEVLEKITNRSAEESIVWIFFMECDHLHSHKLCYKLKISKQFRWITHASK